mgnify:CR=1 FL=1
MRSANNRRARACQAKKVIDPTDFVFTKLISNVSMDSDNSDSENKSMSFLMKDKLNGLSERWFEDINDCTNPSIN